MKRDKVANMDGAVVDMLKNGVISIPVWLLRIFHRCMETGVVPEDWIVMCIVPMFIER